MAGCEKNDTYSVSGLQALLTLFFEIRIPIKPAWGSYPSVEQSNLLGEALETMSVIPIRIGMVQDRPANELAGCNL